MPRMSPSVEGIEPIYRISGWATANVDNRRRVELAIWPPFEEEPGTFCAPMRCGFAFRGLVKCSYGVSPEQALHLAFKFLQSEIDYRQITYDDGRLIEVPVPPEPPLPED